MNALKTFFRTRRHNKTFINSPGVKGHMLDRTERHQLFLQWFIFACALCFALWLAWDQGVLSQILKKDPTRVCYVISLLFLGTTVHCGVRTLFISQQLNLINELEESNDEDEAVLQLEGESVLLNKQPLKASLPVDYLRSILLRYQCCTSAPELQLEHTQLAEILAERARGQHEIGWFISGLALKLGLLGTVIGFVMMLGTVTTMESLDLSDVQSLLSRMTIGMGVALNTTLAGLAANVLLGLQYLMLDRGADKLVSHTVHYAQTAVIPRIAKNGS
jgi:hypothetical protein